MEKLTVILKQHTPLIHFQHEQDGATLRASEVKPRLDKFIISKLGNGDYDDGIQYIKEFIPGCFTSNYSLQYKVKIANDTLGEVEQYMIASYLNNDKIERLNGRSISVISNAPYFAQESENNDVINRNVSWDKVSKKGICFTGNIIVSIVALNKSDVIIKELKNYIQDFFITHNFGTRQSKGFGSFSVEKITYTNINNIDTNVNIKSIEEILKKNFMFVYKKIVLSDFNTIFSTINIDYKLIKSGTNRPYNKSKLMQYFMKDNIRWEKKFIKCFFTNVYENSVGENYVLKSNHMSNYTNGDEDLNYAYVRALLGLAEQYEFLLENPPLGKGKNKLIVKIKSLNENIQRYQSPLLYKVYNNVIFLVGNEVDEQIRGTHFSYLVNIQEDTGYINDLLGDLYTPNTFSLPKFMHFALRSTKYDEIKNNKK